MKDLSGTTITNTHIYARLPSQLHHCFSKSIVCAYPYPSELLSRLEHVTEWNVVDPLDIIDQNGRIYRHGADPVLDDDVIEVLDLPALPFFDDDGNEICIYDTGGYRIPRRIPSRSECYASWINLTRAHELFRPHDDNVHDQRAMPFNAYPQAFLKTAGNIQSPTVPTSLMQYVRTLNQEIAVHVDDDNDDDDEHNDHRSTAIETMFFQSYNEISHRIRDEARFHPVQLGLITSALSGNMATNNSAVRRWRRRVEACQHALPHKRFEEKIRDGGQPEALRNEVTYTIHLNRLKPQLRNGG